MKGFIKLTLTNDRGMMYFAINLIETITNADNSDGARLTLTGQTDHDGWYDVCESAEKIIEMIKEAR